MTYVILGPTGIGKTKLAVDLANFFNCPIISCDAFQIYKDMDIGTGKITKNEEGFDRHYLINQVSPEEQYSVMQYQKDFREIYTTLLKENKNIIVCGGTGLYIKAALYDYVFETYNDDTSDLEKMSNEELKNMLEKIDPESLKTIHVNNKKRLIQAISIARSCNITKSENIKKQDHKILFENVRFIFINPPRKNVYDSINIRVEKMFENGLVEEVKTLATQYHFSKTALQGIGYKEVMAYLNHQLTYEEMVAKLKLETRHYAKRQMTWFKRNPSIKWCTQDEIVNTIIQDLKEESI